MMTKSWSWGSQMAHKKDPIVILYNIQHNINETLVNNLRGGEKTISGDLNLDCPC